MLRRIALALSLALATSVGACKGTEKVVGNPGTATGDRVLANMLPLITKSLTVTSAELAFGFPDTRTLSPPIILSYKVDQGRTLSLGFPDLINTIAFAKLTDKNGGQTDLTILDK